MIRGNRNNMDIHIRKIDCASSDGLNSEDSCTTSSAQVEWVFPEDENDDIVTKGKKENFPNSQSTSLYEHNQLSASISAVRDTSIEPLTTEISPRPELRTNSLPKDQWNILKVHSPFHPLKNSQFMDPNSTDINGSFFNYDTEEFAASPLTASPSAASPLVASPVTGDPTNLSPDSAHYSIPHHQRSTMERLQNDGSFAPRLGNDEFDHNALIAEIRRLGPFVLAASNKEKMICVSCNSNIVSRAFLPCNHASLCDACIDKKNVGPFRFDSKSRNVEIINVSSCFEQLELTDVVPPIDPRGENGFNKLYKIITSAMSETYQTMLFENNTNKSKNIESVERKADIGWDMGSSHQKSSVSYGPEVLQMCWDICPVCHARIFATVECAAPRTAQVETAVQKLVTQYHDLQEDIARELLHNSLSDLTAEGVDTSSLPMSNSLPAEMDGPNNAMWRLRFARVAGVVRNMILEGQQREGEFPEMTQTHDCPIHTFDSDSGKVTSRTIRDIIVFADAQRDATELVCKCPRKSVMRHMEEDANMPILVSSIISTIDSPFVSGFVKGMKESLDVKNLLQMISDSD